MSLTTNQTKYQKPVLTTYFDDRQLSKTSSAIDGDFSYREYSAATAEFLDSTPKTSAGRA
jgi:hypothetical protein